MMFLLSPVSQSTEFLCSGASFFEATHNEQGMEIIQIKNQQLEGFFSSIFIFLTRFISVIHRAIYNTVVRIYIQEMGAYWHRRKKWLEAGTFKDLCNELPPEIHVCPGTVLFY